MDDNGASPDGESSEASHPPHLPRVINITETGDIVLDCVFENSKATLKSAKKAVARPVGQGAPKALQVRSRVGFRVSLDVLKKQSKYFDRLLGDLRFKEAKTIEAAFAALSFKNVSATSAQVEDLPWVRIVDDDKATRLAHREEAFGDMLRVLHGRDAATEAPTLDFIATLAVLADRFDCAAPVSKAMSSRIKLKWPITQRKGAAGEDAKMTRSVENTLRQKILVSWLLNQPTRFQPSTKELLMNGSRNWSAFPEQEEEKEEATWWHLQDGIEEELQFRRECILNTIASIPRHFLGLYISRTRQCKLGYDSSAACDSYQLGEIIKFLTTKNLFFLVDFSPSSLNLIADTSLLQIDNLITTLRQCPGYQVDKYHMNCGLRTRMLPILDFIQALLSTSSVPLSRLSWKNDRKKTAWLPRAEEEEQDLDASNRPFKFTRAMSNDQRLRFEHTMGAEKFARDIFTASSWNWSTED